MAKLRPEVSHDPSYSEIKTFGPTVIYKGEQQLAPEHGKSLALLYYPYWRRLVYDLVFPVHVAFGAQTVEHIRTAGRRGACTKPYSRSRVEKNMAQATAVFDAAGDEHVSQSADGPLISVGPYDRRFLAGYALCGRMPRFGLGSGTGRSVRRRIPHVFRPALSLRLPRRRDHRDGRCRGDGCIMALKRIRCN